MAIAYRTDPGSKRHDNEDYVGSFINKVGRTMVIVADGVILRMKAVRLPVQ